ncbi:MAG: hypothetical protein IKQ67_04340 [Candidatus Methanomethylophilaceae archaeon]|nr:hypothetical protein [Candidatus Methanomethylophilaceae archaeon]
MKKRQIAIATVIIAAAILASFVLTTGIETDSEQTIIDVLDSGPHLTNDSDHQPSTAVIIGTVILIGALVILERYLSA